MSHFDHPSTPTADADAEPFLRIHEAAARLGLTTRTIRYYEELGLLEPVGRTGGDYRQYDADDIERLAFIKGLRDDAGFSLAEIGQLLVDDDARVRNRVRFRSTADATERRAIIDDALVRVDRQIESLREKIRRIGGMVDEAEGRRTHLRDHLAELEAGLEPAVHDHPRPARARAANRSDR